MTNKKKAASGRKRGTNGRFVPKKKITAVKSVPALGPVGKPVRMSAWKIMPKTMAYYAKHPKAAERMGKRKGFIAEAVRTIKFNDGGRKVIDPFVENEMGYDFMPKPSAWVCNGCEFRCDHSRCRKVRARSSNVCVVSEGADPKEVLGLY